MAKMPKIPLADLKKRILTVEADQLKNPPELRPDRAARSSLRRSRAASEKIMARWMKSAGLEVEKLRTAQEAREAELERLVEAHKRGALAQAAKLRNKLHPAVAGQVKALSDITKKPDFFPNPTFTLDTPFLIWSNPLRDVASQAAPFDSWAKFKYKTSQYRGTQKVSFYFYWPNPFSDFAVINATTFMSASGHLKSHAPWGFWVNTSWVAARARFGLWFGVPQEVNPVGYEEWLVGVTGAYGSGPPVARRTRQVYLRACNFRRPCSQCRPEPSWSSRWRSWSTSRMTTATSRLTSRATTSASHARSSCSRSSIRRRGSSYRRKQVAGRLAQCSQHEARNSDASRASA